ncbi:hypothetical protein CBR_g54172 [Chara braunii]|uniref:Uncharacterized protein n=1 Tax=Chara braunii TaxID=69332 RepID=A0A388K772_CHABU|nr:hypothetical protein CBR_g54172 [Chara braunii]|eukprot:GBG65881.1 hypothetical protein CBR_g54172 [Chara braunii]
MERLLKEEEKKMKVVEEEKVEEEEKEESLLRRSAEQRGESSGTKKGDSWMEKKISECVANLSMGEEEEAMLYVPPEEKEAVIREWEAEKDPLRRQAIEEEEKLQWKLRLTTEKKRRMDEASKMAREMEAIKAQREEIQAQEDIQGKLDVILRHIELLARAWEEQHQFARAQDIALHSIRPGFRNFAREMLLHVGAEMQARIEGTEKFCTSAIEGTKMATLKEEVRPHREPVKIKFPEPYSGKKEENFDNWEASINLYIYLQHIVPAEQVLIIAFQALKDEAASFARSLACAAQCEMVAYSKITPFPKFLKLLKERFADVTRGVRVFDKLQTIHSHQWRTARALKGVMDELVVVPDHRVIEALLVNLFYHAMPEPLRVHFFEKSRRPTMTYDILSREAVLLSGAWRRRTVVGVRGGPTLLSRLEGGRKEEEEARAKGVGPQAATPDLEMTAQSCLDVIKGTVPSIVTHRLGLGLITYTDWLPLMRDLVRLEAQDLPGGSGGKKTTNRKRFLSSNRFAAHDLLEVDEETFAEDPSLGDNQEQDCEASCSSSAHESDYVDDGESMNVFKKIAFKRVFCPKVLLNSKSFKNLEESLAWSLLLSVIVKPSLPRMTGWSLSRRDLCSILVTTLWHSSSQ